jgi:hypothetical protein
MTAANWIVLSTVACLVVALAKALIISFIVAADQEEPDEGVAGQAGHHASHLPVATADHSERRLT